MDVIQGELFPVLTISIDSIEKNTVGVEFIPVKTNTWACPICNNTGYTKGTRCACSED